MEKHKKSIWSKLFAPKEGSCCSMRIEEVPEEASREAERKKAGAAGGSRQPSSCCSGAPLEADKKD